MSQPKAKSGCIFFIPVGWLFFFCCAAERALARDGNLIWNAGFAARLVILCLTAGTVTGCGLYGLLLLLEKKRSARAGSPADPETGGKTCFSGRRVFFACWIGIAACWLPFYLAFYPAICSYDITIQLGQIVSHAYNDHHPIFHTLLIGAFLKAGELLGSANLGIALNALFQLLALAASFALGLWLLQRSGAGRGRMILLLLYCCLFPFHGYMSVSITKDTLFGAVFLVQVLMLWQILQSRRNTLRPGLSDLFYVLSGIGAVLLRNNGKYALAVLLCALFPALLFGKGLRRLLGRVLGETALILGGGCLLLSLIFSLCRATQGDRREMLSLPIQQLARTYLYHGGAGALPEDDASMAQEDRDLINEFILDRAYLEYRPEIADNVKRHTNTYVVRYRTEDFLKTYLRLFLEYPGDYLNAALAVDAGYLSPWDESHAHASEDGRIQGLAYIHTWWDEAALTPLGIRADSKWEWLHRVLKRFADTNGYLSVPLLKYIMVPGVYLWWGCLLAAWLAARRRLLPLLPLSLILGYCLTLLLGPTVQLRYIYPVMITLPFLTALPSAGRTGHEGTPLTSGKE